MNLKKTVVVIVLIVIGIVILRSVFSQKQRPGTEPGEAVLAPSEEPSLSPALPENAIPAYEEIVAGAERAAEARYTAEMVRINVEEKLSKERAARQALYREEVKAEATKIPAEAAPSIAELQKKTAHASRSRGITPPPEEKERMKAQGVLAF